MSRRTSEYNRWIAEYVDQNWRTSVVAVHDIGFIRWHSDVRLLDLGGLADDEVTRLHRRGELNPTTFGALTEQAGAAVAIVVQGWAGGEVPEEWTHIASTAPLDEDSLSPEVVFYAVREDAVEHMRETLTGSLESLPPSLSMRFRTTSLSR